MTLPRGLLPINGPSLLAALEQSNNQATLVNVWASWCGSCKAEVPMLLGVAERYGEKGVEVVFVSVDAPQDGEKALAFIEEHEVPLPAYLVAGELQPFKQAMSPLWPGSLPATFLFDGAGKLRYFWGAEVYEEELTPIVDGLLADEDIDGVANVLIRRARRGP